MQILLPVIRADFQMHETYAYRPLAPLSCPISVFGGQQDFHVPEADLRAWRDQTSSGFSLKMFPGDHFFLHAARKPMLRWISDDLACFSGAVRRPAAGLSWPAPRLREAVQWP
jgi:medium-chain acyl-[acyl-carrier-protein] hydrolase